mmetsp:Transcript_2818/g.5122  ORF Transcript_2818/g.5122 Transcript_2818/m.5122 type:complete len:98 (-) Transcript_2818:11-304(-)
MWSSLTTSLACQISEKCKSKLSGAEEAECILMNAFLAALRRSPALGALHAASALFVTFATTNTASQCAKGGNVAGCIWRFNQRRTPPSRSESGTVPS